MHVHAAPEIDGRQLADVAAEREPCICSYCKEAVVHDGEMWLHVRTGLSAHWRNKQCRPLCHECDKPGLVAIGSDQFVGSGIRFVVDHFACAEHVRRNGPFIERT